MPDTLAPAPTTSAFPDALLQDLLAVSLTGVNLLRPLYGPDGSAELVDFAVEYLNPAAQRITGLPERPGGTMRTCFPETFRNGVFAFYQRVYETGEAGRYDFNYQADGFDHYFHVAARRSGERLVVSFTDTADQSRTPVEEALRASQAAEQAARAEAENQRGELQRLFAQSPVATALFQGPDYIIELANESMATIWGRSLAQVLGRPVFEALPYVKGQGFEALFANVLAQGTLHNLHEVPVTIDRTHLGHPALGYFNLTYRPQRDAQGRITGIITSAHEVTEQVLARQQVEQVNQELEARVQERTHELARAQAETEAQRQRLHQLVAEAPALIASLRGPAHVVELANEGFRAIFGGRELVGKPYREAIPEFESQPFFDRLDRVYRTGETYHGIDEPVILDRTNTGQLEETYITYTYQATRDAQGQIDGILVFCYEVTEQVLARQERETQRQRLFALFQEAPAGICLLAGPELVFEFVNPRYQQLMPGRELLNRPVFHALPELVGTPVETILRQVYATGQTQEEQGLLVPVARAADGVLEDRYFTFVYQARRDDQGHVTGVLAFVFEVTEQVLARAQAELSREELKRFQFMADQARDPFILMREDGTFAYLNPKALDAWGYTAEEARHLRVPDVDPIYQDAEFKELFAQAQRSTLPQFETLHRHKDGTIFPVEVSMGGLLLNGQPHLFAIARDITPQKRYVAALQESEARFRTMADAAPNLVWAVQPNSDIRYINRAFLDFVGLDNEEQYAAVGWGPYLHPDELALTSDTLAQAIAQRQPYVLEHRMRRHDGQYRWLLAQGAPSYLTGGELYGYVGSAIDITDLKEANEQLRRTNIDLDNFIYTASHDLKQPIANIEGLLHAIQHELPQAGRVGEVPVLLELMQAAIERFSRTIAHLTDISRLQQEHNQPASLVLLLRVVQEVLLDLAPLQAKTQAQVDVRIPENITLRFSEKNLRSVVYNLLSNAMKYRHPDRAPAVTIIYTLQAAAHLLEVHDNGLGLDVAQDSDKLFGMFKRLHMHVEGTGVGLYMVKKIVENAGGRIEVASTLGQGSTFRVYLPR